MALASLFVAFPDHGRRDRACSNSAARVADRRPGHQAPRVALYLFAVAARRYHMLLSPKASAGRRVDPRLIRSICRSCRLAKSTGWSFCSVCSVCSRRHHFGYIPGTFSGYHWGLPGGAGASSDRERRPHGGADLWEPHPARLNAATPIRYIRVRGPPRQEALGRYGRSPAIGTRTIASARKITGSASQAITTARAFWRSRLR